MAKRFTAVFYTGNKSIGNNGYMKWRNVTNKNRLIRNVLQMYPESKFIHLYDKKSKHRVDYIDLS
jgi:hypothetical protein